MSIEATTAAARAGRRRAARRAYRMLGAAAILGAIGAAWAYASMIRMPGASHRGPAPPPTPREREIEADLRRDVAHLAVEIGDRSVPRPEGLAAAADFVERSFAAAGHPVARQRFEVQGVACDNVEAALPGASRPDEIVVVGAHYDSVAGTTGANDNGSGVAALLALARAFAGKRPARTLRFVAFVNEEPPWFETASMGSRVYAAGCRARAERVVAMISLETLGYYTDAPGSQRYPFPFGLLYPTTGDFVAFVGDTGSAALVRRALGVFRASTPFPSEGVAAPRAVPGVAWSDHGSFWREGYPALMITDTAPFRYPHYHERTDTPDKLSYEATARVVAGLERVVEDLVDGSP